MQSLENLSLGRTVPATLYDAERRDRCRVHLLAVVR